MAPAYRKPTTTKTSTTSNMSSSKPKKLPRQSSPSTTNNHASSASKHSMSTSSLPAADKNGSSKSSSAEDDARTKQRRVKLVEGRKGSSTISEGGGERPNKTTADSGETRKASSVSFQDDRKESKKDSVEKEDEEDNREKPSVISNSDNDDEDERTPLKPRGEVAGGLWKKDIKVVSDLIDDLSHLEPSPSNRRHAPLHRDKHPPSERIPLSFVDPSIDSGGEGSSGLKKQRSASVSTYNSNVGAAGGKGGGTADASGVATPGITEQVSRQSKVKQRRRYRMHRLADVVSCLKSPSRQSSI